MKIDIDLLKDIDDEEFHNIRLNSGNKNDHPQLGVLREHLLCELVKGKKIIHLGCTDHLPVIDHQITNNIWFHNKLLKCADRCAGIYINQAAIKYISEKWNIKDIYYCDATKSIPKELKDTNWDYMIAAEIIEHIDNPVHFLNNIRNVWKNKVREIIFTTPNAFSYNNFREATLFGERNSPDHRFWFTPHTLGKVCFRSGLIPYEFFLVNKVFKKKKPIFDHVLWLQNRFPLLRSNLIMKCKF